MLAVSNLQFAAIPPGCCCSRGSLIRVGSSGVGGCPFFLVFVLRFSFGAFGVIKSLDLRRISSSTPLWTSATSAGALSPDVELSRFLTYRWVFRQDGELNTNDIFDNLITITDFDINLTVVILCRMRVGRHKHLQMGLPYNFHGR